MISGRRGTYYGRFTTTKQRTETFTTLGVCMNKRYYLVLLLTLIFSSHSSSQVFVRITDPTNPIVADGGSPSGSYTGASWVDVNNDGLLDLFINRQAAIYRGIGGGNFVKDNNVILSQGGTFGNTWADYDNDGDIDCFVSGGGTIGSHLYRNDGGAGFTKILSGSMGDSTFNNGWGSAWGDYNNDGYVDLVIAAPNGFAGINHPNRFYHNNGDGTFARIETTVVAMGLAPYTVPTWADYDGDGDIDLFMGSGPANGTVAPDFLYQNFLQETGNAFFQRIATSPIATDLVDGQVWNWIDYDNDGDLDAYLTNYRFSTPNNLYENVGGSFVAKTMGEVGTIVSDQGNSLANTWGDFDNDGDLDCFVTSDAGGGNNSRYYHNNGDGTFTRDDTIAVVAAGPQYGATIGDYDNDGDLDLFVSGTSTTKGLFRNDLSNGYHWLIMKCIGSGGISGSNVSAIGTRIKVKATLNGVPTWLRRDVSSQNSFDCQNMLSAHFGLRDATVIDSVVIIWPRGLVEVYTNMSVDRYVTATEAGGVTSADEVQSALPKLFVLRQNYPNPFNPGTIIEFTIPAVDHVQLKVFNVLGQEVVTLLDEVKGTGQYRVPFNAAHLSGGVYFYQLRYNNRVDIKRMILLK